LYIAAKKGFTEVMRILLDKGGSDIKDSSSKGSSPLFAAAYKGQVEACSLLLERGHSVDLGTEWGTTPLLAAIDNNQIEVVRLLIENGADVDLCADVECEISPIDTAVLENNTEIVRLLLDAGCDLDETHTVPYLLAIKRRDGISCEESKKMILAELEDRKVRQEFDKFINHHIEYQVYKDDIYSVCYPNGNLKVAKPVEIGWDRAKALRDKYFFDETFFYVHCYVASNYTSSKNCSNLIYTARNTNDAFTIMTVLTNRLKFYLKPI
jgi:ankyrin repeat protein